MLRDENASDDGSLQTGPTNFNSELNKLSLLMWKNIRVIWSNWEQFLMTILVPIFFCSILVILRFSLNIDHHPVVNYPILEINDFWGKLMSLIDERKAKINEHIEGSFSNPFIPEKIVGYAPNLLGYANIMKGASDNLQSLVVNSYNTCDDLRSAILKENLIAGVCFTAHDNTDEMIGGFYPNYLQYRLIYPFACRIYHDTFIGISWNTDSLHQFINRTDQRNIGEEDGGYVGYIREGFAPLQNAISMSYLKLVADSAKPNFKMPKIVMCRYPSREFHKDDMVGSVDFSMSLMILLGNFYPVLMFIARIVAEKECTQKSYSKIMGINNYVHCLGWTCNYLLRALISSFVIVVLLKIDWSSGTAILERSNFFTLLLVITVYNITSICFVLMVAPFYTEMVFALSGTALSWFFTYMPYIMSLNTVHDESWSDGLWVVIFHNTALGFVIESILDFELFGEGLTFENFFDTGPLRGQMSIGILMCIMVMQCFLYIGVSLYMEEVMPGNFGLAKRWYFLFTAKKSPSLQAESASSGRALDSVSMESEGSGGHVGRQTQIIYEVGASRSSIVVNLQNVCLAYDNEYVLRNINLQLADDEITILMGHNGSGKTTLLSMMCGLKSITSGKIIIEGFDISTHQRYACASLGLCMGSTLLYPDLTVEDQIRFFSYLKGFQGDSVERALEHYLKATNLSDYRLERTKYLPMGVLQKLAICCALVGKSRVVLLDNPTTHMDLPARALIWKLLENEKHFRTILITSTSANVLESVGDRVAILSNGELQCDGTPVFIKKMYGHGYRLIVTQGPNCNVEDVTRKIQEFIPNITPLSSLGIEINYELHEANSNIFDQLTDSLERSMTTLGIDRVTLRPINIDDIFFKLGAANPSRENRARLMEIMSGQSSYPEESKHLRFMEITERVTGIRKTLQQCQALWSQRWIYATYFKSHYIRRFTYSPLFVLTAFFISSFSSNLKPMPAINFSLEQYESSVTLVERRDVHHESDPILERYKELIFWMNSKHSMEDTEGALLSDFYLDKDLNTLHRLDQDHHVGVTFATDHIIAWFNNVALHSVPLSLNLVHNAILRSIYDRECGIEISLEPLNNMQNFHDGLLRTTISTSHILPLCIAMCVCCIWNTITFTFVREIQSGNDKAQILAGAKFVTYWLVNHAHDTLVILLTSVFITLTIMACQYQLYVGWHIYFWYGFVFTLCGWCIYALNYMIALFFNSPVHAYTFSLSIEAFSITCFCHIIEAFEKDYVDSINSEITSYFHFLPLFSFCSAVSAIYYCGEFERICRDEHIRFISINLENCQAKPNCCRTFGVFRFEDGILLEVMVMGVTIFICWFIVFMAHYKYFRTFSIIPEDDYYAQLNDHKRRHDDTKDYQFGMESSFQEQYQIHKMRNAERRKIPLICDRLGKNFGDKVVIDRMSLVLHRYNCFCILGVSGSGVTTLFNLIAGFNTYSYGRILIKGRNAIYNPDLVRSMIGYGRQEMLIFPELTVKSVLEYVCSLRSYPPQYINEICVNLAKVLGLFSYYHKHLDALSLGILNRLNFAVAVMGNPEIILLDMAIAVIDSAGKRVIWNILKRMQSKGATILMSTTSLRDCERYSSRVGFMSHGRLCLIGTPWDLSNLFADNHYLKVKLSNRTSAVSGGSSHYLYAAGMNKLTGFIHKQFPNSVLKEQRGNYLIFLLPVYCNSISYIFTTLMQNAYYLSIEDFELTHSLLSESFIEFWEKEYGFQLAEERFSFE